MSINKIISQYYKNILPAGFVLLITIMISTSYIAVSQIKQSAMQTSESTKQQYINNKLLKQMSQAVTDRSMVLIDMIQTEDAFELDDLFLKLNALDTNYARSRAKLESQDLEVTFQKLLNKQGIMALTSAPLLNQVYELLQQEYKQQATDLFKYKALPNQKAIINIIKKMGESQTLSAQKTFRASQINTNKTLLKIFIFDIISIILSILIAIFIIRKQSLNDRKLTVLASTDVLTKLPNRSNFTSNLDNYIKEKPTATFAVIFFDVDYFKSINDNYGHDIGDEILRQFSSNIKSAINEDDVLCRFGGDEFVLILKSIKTKEEAINFVSYLSSTLDTYYVIDNNEIFVTASIGASLYSQDGVDAKTLLKNADIAMYTAKEEGRNCYRFYSNEDSERMNKDHVVTQALHTILKNRNTNNELYLMYQPLLNVKNCEMTECEALIRWKNLDGEMIPPDDFIPLAEKSNLIEKVNLFVIDEACKQQSEWHWNGIRNIRININLSGNRVSFKKLLHRLKDNIIKLNLDPALFGVELTERTLYEVSEDTINDLEQVRALGMKISIDDFGTGYSSLSYLKKLPITTLKIDKAFIDGLPADNENRALVRAIITLGHSLDLDIVAEGVETNEQLKFLEEECCNIVQGYYFHKPLDSVQISLLKRIA